MKKNTLASPPEGFRYQTGMLAADEERDLIEVISRLPLKEYEFHGFTARRRVIYYGWQYDSKDHSLQPANQIPVFLHEVHTRAASFAGLTGEDLALIQVIEYRPGAAIGWHKDREIFDDVIGISLLSPCNFRFRRNVGAAWERYSQIIEPRSIYLLRGAAREEWQHSIPSVDALRFSIIFRSLRNKL